MNIFARLFRDEKAVSAVEYALIAAMIVLAMIAGLTSFASAAITMWGDVSNNVMAAS